LSNAHIAPTTQSVNKLEPDISGVCKMAERDQ